MVDDGKWDAALLDGERIVAESASSTVTALLQAAVADVRADERLAEAGVDVAKARAALSVAPLPVDTVHGDAGKRSGIALITIIALFSQLITYISWVATGVVEEKSSRVIELLLSAVRPWQLLTGKLIGIGALAFAQIAAMAVVGLGVAVGTHSVSLPPGSVGVVAMAVGWFVLAFGFYAALAAALGSLVARQEEVSGVLAPVSAILMASYGLGFAAVYAPHSAVARIASIVPPFSAIGMPARLANGGVPIADVLLAVGLMVAATVGVVAIGAKIYRAAVLHTGSRLGIRAAWRSEAVADVR
jgi:ABC-2 type transport system permease protein